MSVQRSNSPLTKPQNFKRSSMPKNTVVTTYPEQPMNNRSLKQESESLNIIRSRKSKIPEETLIKLIQPKPVDRNVKDQSFVIANKTTQKKQPYIKEIQLFWRSLLKEYADKQVQQNKMINEVVRREQNIASLNKWNVFKQRREVAIDAFIKVKKQQRWIIIFTIFRQQHEIIKAALSNYLQFRNARIKQAKRMFAVVYLTVKWRRYMMKFRYSTDFIMLQRIRHCLTTVALPVCSPLPQVRQDSKSSAFLTSSEGPPHPTVLRSICEQKAISHTLRPFFKDLLAKQQQMKYYEKTYNLLIHV